MARKDEVDGNALGSQLAYERSMVGIGERLSRFERTADRLFDADCLLEGMSIRFPGEASADYLVVVRAWRDGKKEVAFHRGDTFQEAVSGVVARLENGSLKWKEDIFA